ncbi:MAG: hypothetical protein KDD22_03085 [Bdellovibrionales bacterium]|nr:hypothetical protein [Bdellovibrionales bacterium]
MFKTTVLLCALFLSACSTMQIPNSGFDDSVLGSGGKAQLGAAGGNTQTVGFNDFETTENKSSVTTSNIGSLILSGAFRLNQNFEISLSSYSAIPFPSIAGVKYQFLGSGVGSEKFTAAISLKTGYSTFSNRGGYSPIGACSGGNTNCAVDDPNGRYSGGNLWAYIFGVPVGIQLNETLRIVVSPRVTYFDGRYALYKKAQLTDTTFAEHKFGISGLRKSLAVSGFYLFNHSLAGHLTIQAHDYTWNAFARSQHLSAYLGLSYVIGSAVN